MKIIFIPKGQLFLENRIVFSKILFIFYKIGEGQHFHNFLNFTLAHSKKVGIWSTFKIELFIQDLQEFLIRYATCLLFYKFPGVGCNLTL